MNRKKLKNDMEIAWELRPHTDLTPQTDAHANRFRVPRTPNAPEASAQRTQKPGKDRS